MLTNPTPATMIVLTIATDCIGVVEVHLLNGIKEL